jgi:hypothetical protein
MMKDLVIQLQVYGGLYDMLGRDKLLDIVARDARAIAEGEIKKYENSLQDEEADEGAK